MINTQSLVRIVKRRWIHNAHFLKTLQGRLVHDPNVRLVLGLALILNSNGSVNVWLPFTELPEPP